MAQKGGANTKFVDELDRNFLEKKLMKRQFADSSQVPPSTPLLARVPPPRGSSPRHPRQVKRTTMMTRLMHLVHEMTRKGIHATKRDLFYADVKLFEKQTNSDALLEELALMLGCTRHSLMVTASEKGVVIGRVQFRDDGDDIDCTRMGGSGKNIPNSMDRITDIK